jgi:hypothetical protein
MKLASLSYGGLEFIRFQSSWWSKHTSPSFHIFLFLYVGSSKKLSFRFPVNKPDLQLPRVKDAEVTVLIEVLNDSNHCINKNFFNLLYTNLSCLTDVNTFDLTFNMPPQVGIFGKWHLGTGSTCWIGSNDMAQISVGINMKNLGGFLVQKLPIRL